MNKLVPKVEVIPKLEVVYENDPKENRFIARVYLDGKLIREQFLTYSEYHSYDYSIRTVARSDQKNLHT